jgi:hypothetical protein
MQAAINHDYLIQYDDVCGDASSSEICYLSVILPHDMKSPKVYYKLENFYANHRNFVKSRSYKQQRASTTSATSDCSPVKEMSDLLESEQGYSYGGKKLSGNDTANPCGLIAKYYFQDAYALYETESMKMINISETGIAHKVDIDYKFKAPSDAETI